MALNTAGITRQIKVTPSRCFPGAETVEIPGLGFWLSRETAQTALDKLDRGECPMKHTVDIGPARACHICGETETVTR